MDLLDRRQPILNPGTGGGIAVAAESSNSLMSPSSTISNQSAGGTVQTQTVQHHPPQGMGGAFPPQRGPGTSGGLQNPGTPLASVGAASPLAGASSHGSGVTGTRDGAAFFPDGGKILNYQKICAY